MGGMVMSKSENLHAIVLASEEDHNLKPLTEALGEVDTSKQFASIAGGGSLLQQTVARYVSQVPPVLGQSCFHLMEHPSDGCWSGNGLLPSSRDSIASARSRRVTLVESFQESSIRPR
jgi:hypothetical protein